MAVKFEPANRVNQAEPNHGFVAGQIGLYFVRSGNGWAKVWRATRVGAMDVGWAKAPEDWAHSGMHSRGPVMASAGAQADGGKRGGRIIWRASENQIFQVIDIQQVEMSKVVAAGKGAT